MNTENKNIRPLATSLVVLGVLARLLPHPPNMTPVGSVSLFAGSRMPGWQAYLVPLVIMTISSPIMHAIFGMGGESAFGLHTLWVYGSFMINVWIGRTFLKKTESVLKIGGAAFACSLQFFLVTNFGMWLYSGMYPQTMEGLAACFIAAIPFWGYTVAGDLMYSGVLFGAHSVLSRKIETGERVVPAAA